MLGFFIGTICLVGLVKVLRYGRLGHSRYGFRGGYAMHGWRGRHGGFGSSRGRGMLKWAFWRLDATHGQEKVIIAEWETLSDTLRGLRTEVGRSRAAAAQLARGETLDAEALQAVWQEHDALLAKLRTALGQGLIRVHAALDESQRKVLAQWLENGPGYGC